MNFFFNLMLAVTPVAAPATLKLDMTSTTGQVQMTMPVQIMILMTLLSFLPGLSSRCHRLRESSLCSISFGRRWERRKRHRIRF